MSSAKYVHLHVHSEYSVLDGACRIIDLYKEAAKYKMPALAITDHGNLHGAIEFFRAAEGTGVKPIIGSEMYIAPASRFDKKPSNNKNTAFHLTLLAKDYEGYKNLIKLSTIGHLEGFYYKPRIDKEVLEKHAKGLICMSGCIKGEVAQLLLSGHVQEANDAVNYYKSVFGADNYFVEVHDHGIPEQKKVLPALVDLAKKSGIGLVAANDCHYIGRKDAAAHDALLCIQTGTVLSEEKRLKLYNDQFYFKSPAEMAEVFAEMPEALHNTVAIAERCNLALSFDKKFLPRFTVPEGLSPGQYLRKLCADGLSARYGNITAEISRRLEHELSVIEKMNYESYFLIVWDLIRFAREKNITVGPGRGSAAGSIVAYVLCITDIDPLPYTLLFERFLNPDRVSLPDIDIDFCFIRRGEVIEYVSKKYGASNVAQIITFGTLGAKAVIRDVGRVLGLPYGDVDRIAKLIPNDPKIDSLTKAFASQPALKQISDNDRLYKKLFDYAFTLEGLVRNVSTHAAGVVISEVPLVEHVPLTRGSTDEIVTQYQKGDVEKIGLLKMDFLGLKTLTVLSDAVNNISCVKGINIDLRNIPLNDKETFELLNQANTAGVFQLESPGMRDVARRIGLTRFDHIIALIAIFRPGPMKMLDDFIARKEGKTKISYDHPLLEEILKDTYGIMLYQEQVMKVANVIAGYSMAEADNLRRIMADKKPDKMEKQRASFIKGAVNGGIPSTVAEKIFEKIAFFAEYGFNKSHSAAYALISYRTAYLKAHYPQEYMAALLSSEMGNVEKITKYIDECRRLGIKILPPDINQSASRFTVVDNDIRFGLSAVKNIGAQAVECVLKERTAQGPYKSFYDYVERVDSRLVNKKTIESMIKCGAFDSLGHKRAELSAVLEEVISVAWTNRKDREIGQGSFTGIFEDKEQTPVRMPKDIQEWTQSELLAHEKELLGFYVTGHPLDKHLDVIKRYLPMRVASLGEVIGEKEIMIGGIISKVKHMVTKRKKEKMGIMTIEDYEGNNIEVLVFPEAYKKCSEAIVEEKIVYVKGKVDKTEDAPKLVASEIDGMDKLREKYTRAIFIKINDDQSKNAKVNQFKTLCQRNPGKCPVFISLVMSDGSIVTVAANENLWVKPAESFLNSMETLFGKENIEMKA